MGEQLDKLYLEISQFTRAKTHEQMAFARAATWVRQKLVGDKCIHSGKPGRMYECSKCPLNPIQQDAGLDYEAFEMLCDLEKEFSK